LSAALQWQLSRIHPYGDGNGRLSRLLGDIVLVRAGLLPTLLHADDRSAYLHAMEWADCGDGSHLYDWVLHGLRLSMVSAA
jgi:Fic family protein